MSLPTLHRQIIACKKCERLRTWCETVAKEKRKAFINDEYWGKPVPGYGDPNAEILVIGLAPAAHGANRTGRMFTGDNSGLWLYHALFEHGFSNQKESLHRKDGLQLINAYITSIVHCAPPDNKPTTQETDQCIEYLRQEFQLLQNCKVILALGAFAWNGIFRIFKKTGLVTQKPKFGHGVIENIGPYKVIGSYHPSQQNTFTKKLTKEMFDNIFKTIQKFLEK